MIRLPWHLFFVLTLTAITGAASALTPTAPLPPYIFLNVQPWAVFDISASAEGSVCPGDPGWTPVYEFRFTIQRGLDRTVIYNGQRQFLELENVDRGDFVWLEARSNHGGDRSPWVAGEYPPLLITNLAPLPPTGLVYSTAHPTTDQPLAGTAEGGKDRDTDFFHYDYVWSRKQGSSWIDVAPERYLNPHTHKRGEVWRLRARTNDGLAVTTWFYGPEITIENSPPTTPSKPLIQPANPSADDVLTAQSYGSTDADGDAVVTPYRYDWFRNDSGTWNYVQTGAALPATLTERGQQWRVKSRASDGNATGEWSDYSDVVTILNQPPTAPARPVIAPNAPQDNDNLQAKSAGGSTDPDGDAVTLSWSWYYKFPADFRWSRAAGTTDTVPAAATQVGQLWYARLTASDGVATVSVNSDLVTIGRVNSPPTAPASVTITENLNNLVGTASGATDPDDDDLTYEYQWYERVGKEWVEAFAGQTLNAAMLKVGSIYRVGARTFDGTVYSTPSYSASWTVTANTQPGTPPTPVISPAAPGTGSDLVATTAGSSDLNGDNLTYEWCWWVRTTGSYVQLPANHTDTMPAKVTTRGETYRVECRAYDGLLYSLWSSYSNEVTIGNTPPPAPINVTVRPDPATGADTLRAATGGSADDPDGDTVTIKWLWFKDGVSTGIITSYVSASQTALGESWVVKARARDSQGAYSDWVASAPVIIGDTPPTNPTWAKIVPDSADTTTELTARAGGATDPDGDAVTYDFTWFKLGDRSKLVETPYTGRTLPADATTKGETWVVGARAKANGLLSEFTYSAPLLIRDAAPTLPVQPVISPAAPKTQADLRIAAPSGSFDPDGDAIVYRIQWFRDAGSGFQPQPYTGVTVPDEATTKGEQWLVQVTAGNEDGTIQSAAVLSESVTIANTKPTAPADVVVRPTRPTDSDDLGCGMTASTDADGDTIRYQFAWEYSREGGVVFYPYQPQPGDTSTRVIIAARTTIGDYWRVKIRARDDEAWSDWTTSDPVIIYPDPSGATLTLSAAAGTTATGADLAITLSTAATAEVEIINVAGRQIATIPARNLPSGTTHLTWNGLSATGTRAPAGPYVAVVECRTANGATARTAAPFTIKR